MVWQNSSKQKYFVLELFCQTTKHSKTAPNCWSKCSRVETHANGMKIMGNPGCRCRSQRYWQWGPWPRSWKSRPGVWQICRNFPHYEFILLENFQLPRYDTLSVGRQKGSRDGVGLVKTCALALQLECSVPFIWGEFYQVVDMMSILCILYTYYLQELEDLLQVSGSSSILGHL